MARPVNAPGSPGHSQLDGRTAVVTGAAQGIGLATARALHAAGARVVLADLDAERVAATSAELDAGGERTAGIPVDVRDRASVADLLNGAIERFGSLDILVNNAAVTSGQPFAEIGESDWDDVLAVNLRGVFFGCQLAAPIMSSAGWGRIVNLASNAGQQPNAHVGAHYAAAKAGVIALTKRVAVELAGHGVTVNAVAPAFITGPIMDGLPADVVETLRQSLPVARLGTPDEVAALVAFLAGEQAGFITGATYDINGGLLMN